MSFRDGLTFWCIRIWNSLGCYILRFLVKDQQPQCVFLSYIKVDEARIESIRQRLWFYRYFSMPTKENTGGVTFLWRAGVNVLEMEGKRIWMIKVKLEVDPNRSKSQVFWQTLGAIYDWKLWWVRVGDFKSVV